MAIDQEASPGSRVAVEPKGREMSWGALVAVVSLVVVLVAWFFFAWLALDRHIVDAAGESIGSGFALLLLISIVGSFRARGRP